MQRYKKQCRLMGCSFELGVVAAHQEEAHDFLEMGIREIQRIENLLSEFKADSIVSKINQNAGKAPVKITDEVLQLLERCQKISHLSKGYFDITVGPLKKLYRFKNEAFAFPKKNAIERTLHQVGFQNLILDTKGRSAFLTRENMRISFAAIGKGYAADVVRQKWREHKLVGGYIDASGDLTAFGKDERGAAWKIGIANPDDRDQTLFYVPLHNASVATSGDYEQHFLYKGVRYSHNINPITGMPVSGVKSVSVFSPSAELSDALATAVYAMGIEKGISFLNQLPQTHGIIIDDHNQVFFSKQLQYETAAV